jgi:hypothetical protein
MAESPVVQLEYGHAPPMRRRWWVRGAVALAAMLVVGLLVWRVGLPVYARLWTLYWQRRAIDYLQPADHLGYTERVEDAIGYPKGLGPGQRLGWGADPANTANFSAHQPPIPLAVRGLNSGSLFLHERRAAGVGKPTRLVSVDVAGANRLAQLRPNPPPGLMMLYADVIELGTLTRPPRVRWGRFVQLDGRLTEVPVGTLRIYSGQPDPADASHFTLAYETAEGRGTIDGWLMSDDSVKMAVRDGPAAATQPAGATN